MLKKLVLEKRYRELHLFILVFIINLATAFNYKMIRVSTDEFGVLASAAYFSGKDWSSLVSELAGYYGYGQAILYTPFFLFFKNPIHLYQALIVLNSVIISIIPVLAYKIIKLSFSMVNEKQAIAISILVAIYPGNLLYSKFAWYEPTLYLLPWLLIWLIGKSINHISKKSSVAIALVLVFGYMIHGRAIGFIISICLCSILYFMYMRKNFLHVKAFTTVLIAGILLDNVIKNVLMDNLWKINSESQVNNTLASTVQKTLNFLNFDGLQASVTGSFGQIYYVSSASMGLFLIAASAIVVFVFGFVRGKHRKEDPADERICLLTTISLLLYIIGLFISVTFLLGGISDSESRGDYFIYGRYTENLVSPVLALGLCIILTAKVEFKKIFKYSMIIYIFLSGFSIFYLQNSIMQRSNIAALPILSIMPYINNSVEGLVNLYVTNINFLLLTIIVLLISLVVFFLFLKNKQLHGIIFISIVYLYTYVSVSTTALIPNSNNFYSYVKETYNMFDTFDDLYKQYNKVYLLYMQETKPWSDACYQFVLLNYEVINYTGSLNELEKTIQENSIIISPNELNLHVQENSSFYKVVTEIEGISTTDYIYVYGEEINRYFNENLPVYTINEMNSSLFTFPNEAVKEMDDT